MMVAAAAIPVAPSVNAEGADAEQSLAEKWAPFVEVQQQASECGPGEPYLPTPVETVLGRDDVVLRAADGSVITTAPTAADLYAAPDDAHLDFPGNALEPNCDYERWFREVNGDQAPSVYARVVTDPDEPDLLVLQYWFFWVFNDWNDKHEGDWEMFQMVFDAPTAQEALDREPIELAAAQHEGAERRSFDRLETRDGRPVVYPSAGSHATYYSSDRWFGASASAGFGCDNTLAPSDSLRPEVVLLPAEVSGPDDPFAWLAWEGRWGEQQPAFNNGPTGPNTKTQWGDPIGWMSDNGRSSSISLPARGSAVTDFFCSASRQGSLLFIRFLREPWAVLAALAVLVAFIVWAVRTNLPILKRASAQLRSHRRRFLPISAFVLLGGMGIAATQSLLLLIPGDETTGLVLVLGTLASLSVSVIASASTITLLRNIRSGAEPTDRPVRRGLRSAALRTSAPVTAIVLVAALIPAASLGLLLAWCVAPSVAAFEGLRPWQAATRSFRLTRGRRWRVVVITILTFVVATVPGPLTGTVVLLLTGASFALVNLIAGVFGALLVPWLGSVICALYLELSGDPVAWGAPKSSEHA
ncbi:MAG: hypothetical protein KGR47_04350 [Acidobacteria bacterium]|nr:hypothetical protein [Acidobacteriota bacterium]